MPMAHIGHTGMIQGMKILIIYLATAQFTNSVMENNIINRLMNIIIA